MTAEAEIMLEQWGRWHRGNSSLLIPKRSIIGRVMDEGTGASHTTVEGVPHMPPVVEVTERFCLTLQKHLLRAIKHYYIGQETARTASRKLKISEDEFARRISFTVGELSLFLVED